MWKSGVVAFLAAAVLSPCMAQADAFNQGMNTLWEVLWHQSGTATRLVRWNKDVKFRIYGVNVAAHREHTLEALHAVAAEAGVKVIDVSDRPDAAQVANLSIEITPDNTLADNQPCETRLNFEDETTIDSVTTQMRDSDAYRCAYHESMHMMGVRGHPEGDTVLSYFTTHVDSLLPLDKVMLHAWYSPRAKPGMTPFEFLPILADELVAILPDRAQALQERDAFLARTVQQMQAFADGKADAPKIIAECGKETEVGLQFGRMEMSYFLGVAYLKGTSVARDTTLAAQWLQKAANQGERSAVAGLESVSAVGASGR